MQRKMGVPKNRLAKLRRGHKGKVTQTQLAALCGVEPRSYGRWENYDSPAAVPIPSTCAIKLCQFFRCSLDYLYCLTSDRTPPPRLDKWKG